MTKFVNRKQLRKYHLHDITKKYITQKLMDKPYNLQQTHTCLVTSLLLILKLLIIPI